MNLHKAVFTQGSVLRHVVNMTGSSTTSLLAIFVVDVLAVFYISMLKDDALLAALVVGKTLMFFISSLAIGIAMAAGALIATCLGAGDALRARQLSSAGLVLALLVALGGAGAGWLFLDTLLSVLGLEARTLAAASAYLHITLPGTVIMAVGHTCMQLLRTTGMSKQPMFILLLSTVVAALVDPLLILWFDLGLEGAGYAYVLWSILIASSGLYYVHRVARLTARPTLKSVLPDIGHIGRVAVPAIFGNLATPVGMAYLMSVVAQYGPQALAGIAVVDRILQLSFCVFFVLPGALGPIIGQNLGAGNVQRARAAIKTTYGLTLCYGAAVSLLLGVSVGGIGAMFNVQGEGQQILEAFCRFGGMLWTVIGMQFIAIAIFVSMGRAIYVTVFGWLRASLGTVPFVWYGAQLHGSTGALLGHLIGNALVALTACWVARRVANNALQQANEGLGHTAFES